MIKKWIYIIAFVAPFLASCTGRIINVGSCAPINLDAKIAVIPFVNNTETPLAGERAMSITAAVLESRGICCIEVYQKRLAGKVLFPGMNQVQSRHSLMAWARSKHARYVLTGNVNEWTYKVGLDGEPVAGVSLQIIDLANDKIIWTAVGSISRGSRIALTTAAQDLINSLLDGLFLPNCAYEK